jgi:hypothetical protein
MARQESQVVVAVAESELLLEAPALRGWVLAERAERAEPAGGAEGAEGAEGGEQRSNSSPSNSSP